MFHLFVIESNIGPRTNRLVQLVKSIVFIVITQQMEQKGNNVIHHLTISSGSYITLNDK
jgi:hypothetical protein